MALKVVYKRASFLPYQVVSEKDGFTITLKRFRKRETAETWKAANARLSIINNGGKNNFLDSVLGFLVHHGTLALGVAVGSIVYAALFGGSR